MVAHPVHPARQAHRPADVAGAELGAGVAAVGMHREAPRGGSGADTPRAPRRCQAVHQPRRQKPPQRVADEEPPLARGRRAASTASRQRPSASSAARSTPGSSPADEGRRHQPVPPLEEDRGDRPVPDLAALVQEHRLVHPLRQRRPRRVVHRAARVVFTPSQGSSEASRSPATRTRHSAFACRQRRRLHRRPAVEPHRQPHPQRPGPRHRGERPLHRRSVERDPERGRAARQPREMPRQPHEPRLRLPAEGLDQPQVGGSGAAKRAFHRASSYSAAAVESATIPPPTFSTASPSG